MSYPNIQNAVVPHRGTTRRPGSPGGAEPADAESYVDDDMHDRTGEPGRTKRTPRACESCRRRKIRCNGGEVCGGCRASSLMCVYRDADDARMVKEHMRQFDSRLQRIEHVLADFMTKIEAAVQSQGQNQTSLPEKLVDDAANEIRKETRTSAKRPAESQAVACAPSPPLSYAQDAQDAESSELPAPLSEVVSAPAAKRRRHRHGQHRPMYADGYGELHADEWGQLRYIGLSSTMSVIDICMPFREHINRGLEKKGYDYHNNFLGPALSVCAAVTLQSGNSGNGEGEGDRDGDGSRPGLHAARPFAYGHLPPAPLIQLLVQCFYDRMHRILPVLARPDLEAQLAALDNAPDHDAAVRQSDFLPVLYGLLSVGALNLPADSLRADDPALAPYRDIDLGASYFALSSAGGPAGGPHHTNGLGHGHGHSFGRPPPQLYPRRSLNPIIALVLQAAYLAAVGSQAEAWISIGQAARLGQDLGLHRSASQLGFPKAEQERRRFAWWCIYSLDRTLSAALGRPLAIRDADCDMELPQSDEEDGDGDPSGGGSDSAGFAAILNLRRILGDIVTTVAAVRTVKASRHVSKTREVQAIVGGLHAELQTWAAHEVPAPIKTATEGAAAVDKCIALSGHFGALLLLYRFFIGHPHRASPLAGDDALLQCARAATHCIRITDQMVPRMPVCADLVLHVQHVFTSSVILLQCIRRSSDSGFVREALLDVEQATRCLRRLQQQWSGATRLLAQVEEYVEFTLAFIENGVARAGPGRCAFHHEQSEFTGLEIRDDDDEGSGRFPPDWAQLAWKRLPTGPPHHAAAAAAATTHPHATSTSTRTNSPTRPALSASACHGRNPYPYPRAAVHPTPPASNPTNGPTADPGAELPTPDDGPSSGASPAPTNLFRFALPQQRPVGINTTTPTAATGVHSNVFAHNPRHMAPFLTTSKAAQPCHPSCHEDDTTRSWGGGQGVTDSLMENFWIGDIDGNRFLDNAALLSGDTIWGLQAL